MTNHIPAKCTDLGRRAGRNAQGKALRAAMGEICAAELASRFGRPRGKNIARFLRDAGADVDDETVKRWLSGSLPQNEHLAILYRELGIDFAKAVLRPCFQRDVQPTPQEEIARIIRRLSQIEEELRRGLRVPTSSDCVAEGHISRSLLPR